MGTRNLTCVIHNGEYKIAQYGQWDGYPDGQGLTVLEFLRNTDLSKFKDRLNNVRFLTEIEGEKIDVKYGAKWKEYYPQLSRDNGAEILQMVMDGANELQNEIEFAKDGLMCEWSYIIDLDNNVFEAYSGGFDVEDRQPHALWALSELPKNKEFVDTFKENEGE